MEPLDKPFIDKIEATKFKANKADRAENTQQIVKKLDELKPTEKARSKQDAMSAFFESMKGDQGEKGETGEQGIQGEAGPQGETGQQGEQGSEGIQGIQGEKGEQGDKGEDGQNGVDGKDGKDGKDGSPDIADQIVEKLQTIKQAWLELSAIKGLDEILNEMGTNFLQQAKALVPRSFSGLYDVNLNGLTDGQTLVYNAETGKWKPGTAAASGSLTVETPSGTIDNANTTFTVSFTPVFITLNGQVLTASGVDYTYSAGTITMVQAPLTGDILRSYHN